MELKKLDTGWGLALFTAVKLSGRGKTLTSQPSSLTEFRFTVVHSVNKLEPGSKDS